MLPARRAPAVLSAVLAAAAGLLAVSPAAALGEKAVADMTGTDGKSLGTIEIRESVAGVLLSVKLKGLGPGPHGFHLHDSAKCEPPKFESAGAIHNPLGAKHGFLNEEGPQLGDLPNLIADATGAVNVELHNPFVTLNKEADENILGGKGTALVLFEKADDYKTDPDGGAGARIACGVVKSAP